MFAWFVVVLQARCAQKCPLQLSGHLPQRSDLAGSSQDVPSHVRKLQGDEVVHTLDEN